MNSQCIIETAVAVLTSSSSIYVCSLYTIILGANCIIEHNSENNKQNGLSSSVYLV